MDGPLGSQLIPIFVEVVFLTFDPVFDGYDDMLGFLRLVRIYNFPFSRIERQGVDTPTRRFFATNGRVQNEIDNQPLCLAKDRLVMDALAPCLDLFITWKCKGEFVDLDLAFSRLNRFCFVGFAVAMRARQIGARHGRNKDLLAQSLVQPTTESRARPEPLN